MAISIIINIFISSIVLINVVKTDVVTIELKRQKEIGQDNKKEIGQDNKKEIGQDNKKEIGQHNSQISSSRFLEQKNQTSLSLESESHSDHPTFRYLFFGEVGIGKGVDGDNEKVQKFKLLFDTGGCELWVMGAKCKSTQCTTNTQYKDTNTKQIQDIGELDISYMDGLIEGILMKEDIYLGDTLLVKQQTVGLALQNSLDFMKQGVYIDGVLGLGRPNAKYQTLAVQTLVTNYQQQTGKGVFAIYMGKEGGAITFGGHEPKYMHNQGIDFRWAPVADPNYWVIELVGVQKVYVKDDSERWEDQKMCGIGCKAILDTGSYFIYGPKEYIQKINKDIQIEDCNDLKGLPNVVIEVVTFTQEGKKHVLQMRFDPRDYVVDYGSSCVSGFMEDEYNHGWTFGSLFFQTFYTKFDLDNQQIGFVRAKVKDDDN